ncbi:MAG: general stress protein CsbD [Ignavibacteriales bacterium]|nr:general stress protein CsbD [Ignavibacteriales bacterium]
MEKLIINGNWDELVGKLKQQYSTLTDDDLILIEGKEDDLVWRLKKKLRMSREQVREIIASL